MRGFPRWGWKNALMQKTCAKLIQRSISSSLEFRAIATQRLARATEKKTNSLWKCKQRREIAESTSKQ
jgi:hypothetical protein